MSSSDSDDMSMAAKWFLLGQVSNKRFRNHFITEQRFEFGEYHHLFPQLEEDDTKFREYLRMTKETFEYILSLFERKLLQKYSYQNFHLAPILPKEKLVITLRFLATGCSFRSLAFSFRMGATTVGKIVREVCDLLWETLQPLHMKPPVQADFERISERYETVWGFPNCIGAIDGKHVRIKCPAHSGSHYFNYKKYFSIVLQGLVDDHYRFIAIDVGGFGKQSDGGTFSASSIGRLLEARQLEIPPEKCLPNSNIKVPHVFIADEAYPLKENLMKPFSKAKLGPEQEKFNSALSRARKTVECAFGILYAKWRILSGTMETHPETCDILIKAMCVLHNTIIDKEGYILDLELADIVQSRSMQRTRAHNRSNASAAQVRDKFKTYFA